MDSQISFEELFNICLQQNYQWCKKIFHDTSQEQNKASERLHKNEDSRLPTAEREITQTSVSFTAKWDALIILISAPFEVSESLN